MNSLTINNLVQALEKYLMESALSGKKRFVYLEKTAPTAYSIRTDHETKQDAEKHRPKGNCFLVDKLTGDWISE